MTLLDAISSRMDSQGNKIVICDNGTGFMKCGFAGQNMPELVLPSIVGTPMIRSQIRKGSFHNVTQDTVVGEQANIQRQMLDIHYPMKNGVVQDWEDMNTIYENIFSKNYLNIDPAQSKIMLTEAPLNPTRNREKMLEVMLEQFQFRGCYVAVQAVLTLFAQGVSTGIVADCGDGVTHICPVYESFCLSHLVKRLDIAEKLLQSRGYSFNHTADFETARMIKEKLCYIAHDLELENMLASETTTLNRDFVLPDGREIKLSSERFQAAEVIFQPHLINIESPGLDELIFGTIQEAPIDLRSAFLKRIVLSGGSTMFPGLPTRLECELRKMYLKRILKGDTSRMSRCEVQVEDPPRRKFLVFLGGSMLANVTKDMNDVWVTREDYQEKGVHFCLQKLNQPLLG